jgi:hypothetical protein
VLLQGELLIQALLAAGNSLDTVATLVDHCVMKLAKTGTVRHTGCSAIGPMNEMVNL